ncbi:hypothetical protein IE81DRAFT_126254 [Ceraceosorus guamensis]|uniref:BHLH domain-containing protein n=1 Tax=Ceraceosorus guamensis TaxID=1522189 RepID=A0A316W7E5_9BASI|nr:hypothetical protein IE81DRAFT_126254 [Ceraceosorus guamensis]PWN45779.1 hypothetical protein IE81DRAFT_126254 [Ceraceosorus guamensis]
MPTIASSTAKAKALEEEDAAPPRSASTRKTRPLRRKTSHSVIERRRREKINERLIRLQESVPACRQEAQEMLSSKLSNVKGKKRLAEADRQEEIERRIKQEMVLEKLCIISHTVGACCEPFASMQLRSMGLTRRFPFPSPVLPPLTDHLAELQAQVAAFRRLCRCSPPITLPNPPSPHAHAKFAHAHGHAASAEEGEEEEEEEEGIALEHGSDGDDARANDCDEKQRGGASERVQASAVYAPKRKRHWGSNRPPRGEAAPASDKRKRSKIDSKDRKVAAHEASAQNSHSVEGGRAVKVQDEALVSDAESHDGDSSASELAFESPLPIQQAWDHAHRPIPAAGPPMTSARRRRATDAGFTPGPEGHGEESMHACGHSHPPGGHAPGVQYPGAAHHYGYRHEPLASIQKTLTSKGDHVARSEAPELPATCLPWSSQGALQHSYRQPSYHRALPHLWALPSPSQPLFSPASASWPNASADSRADGAESPRGSADSSFASSRIHLAPIRTIRTVRDDFERGNRCEGPPVFHRPRSLSPTRPISDLQERRSPHFDLRALPSIRHLNIEQSRQLDQQAPCVDEDAQPEPAIRSAHVQKRTPMMSCSPSFPSSTHESPNTSPSSPSSSSSAASGSKSASAGLDILAAAVSGERRQTSTEVRELDHPKLAKQRPRKDPLLARRIL